MVSLGPLSQTEANQSSAHFPPKSEPLSMKFQIPLPLYPKEPKALKHDSRPSSQERGSGAAP